MNFTKFLQDQLREKKYLSINDVMSLSIACNHYFDTARRKLEPDITPYSEKIEENHRIKGWKYVKEKDIAETLNVKGIEIYNKQKKIQNPLFNFQTPF